VTKRSSTPGYHPIKKIKFILKGLYIAVLTDFSVAYKLALSIPIVIFAAVFYQWVDLTLILLATGVMLLGELLNSAILQGERLRQRNPL
jgi:diacylglycerol kinase